MAFNQIVRGAQKPYEFPIHIKDVEHSESIRPHGKFMPAPWLPVKLRDEHRKEWYVMSVGTAVQLDISGHLIPAGMNAGDSVVYAVNDQEAGVIDVTTGLPVSGLDPVVTPTVTRVIPADQIDPLARPVGVISHNVFQALGAISSTAVGAGFIYSYNYYNPTSGFGRHNYSGMDALTTILCDYVIRVPYLPVDTVLPGAAITATALSATARFITHAHLDATNGALAPGMMVKADINGNYIPYDPAEPGADPTQIIGQVIWMEDYFDKAALSKVRSPGTAGDFGATQGSATGGLDISIHLCTDGAVANGTALVGFVQADITKMVAINLLK